MYVIIITIGSKNTRNFFLPQGAYKCMELSFHKTQMCMHISFVLALLWLCKHTAGCFISKEYPFMQRSSFQSALRFHFSSLLHWINSIFLQSIYALCFLTGKFSKWMNEYIFQCKEPKMFFGGGAKNVPQKPVKIGIKPIITGRKHKKCKTK